MVLAIGGTALHTYWFILEMLLIVLSVLMQRRRKLAVTPFQR